MIFLDTSFVVAYYNNRDSNHDKALKLMRVLESGRYGHFCMTDYIFSECATVIFVRLKNLLKTAKIGDDITRITRIFITGKDVFEDSWQIFKSQENTKLSFADCSIVSFMKRAKIKHIATFDEDFNRISGITAVS